MRKGTYALFALLVLSSSIASASAQVFPIAVSLNTGTIPIGQITPVGVTVKNIVNNTVQLVFVGLQFSEWSKPDFYFIGGNSDKGAVLAAGESITYTISVQTPGNVTPGPHKLNTLVTYRWFKNGNWTGDLSGLWVGDVQLTLPQTPSQGTTQTGTEQTSVMETAAVLVAVVAIGLFLERRRLKHIAQRYRKASPEAAKREGEKPAMKQKREDEDV